MRVLMFYVFAVNYSITCECLSIIVYEIPIVIILNGCSRHLVVWPTTTEHTTRAWQDCRKLLSIPASVEWSLLHNVKCECNTVWYDRENVGLTTVNITDIAGWAVVDCSRFSFAFTVVCVK